MYTPSALTAAASATSSAIMKATSAARVTSRMYSAKFCFSTPVNCASFKITIETPALTACATKPATSSTYCDPITNVLANCSALNVMIHLRKSVILYICKYKVFKLLRQRKRTVLQRSASDYFVCLVLARHSVNFVCRMAANARYNKENAPLCVTN